MLLVINGNVDIFTEDGCELFGVFKFLQKHFLNALDFRNLSGLSQDNC